MKSNINPSILHIIMGLVLCLLICSYLKLDKQTTLVTLTIIVLTIYIIENIIKKIFNKKKLREIKTINNKINNTINNSKKNNIINKTDNIKGCTPKITMVKMEVPIGNDYPSINDLDECTVDGSCIQKPDDNNLFSGFANKNKKENNKRKKKIIKIVKSRILRIKLKI